MANSFGRTRYRRPEEARNAFRQDGLRRELRQRRGVRLFCSEVGDERAELAWHGPNHSPDNIFIHP
jgi:hypothetical protein